MNVHRLIFVMRMFLVKTVFCGLIAVWALPVDAGAAAPVAQAPPAARSHAIARLPLELRTGHIVVPVLINDSRPINMILDTGMPADGVSIFSDDAVEELDLSFSRTARIRGAGGDPPRDAKVACGAEVTIAGISFTKQTVTRLLLEREYIKPYLDEGIEGIVGYMIFSRYIVGLDFTNDEIAFYDHETFRQEREYGRMPLVIRSKAPYIDVSITSDRKEDAPARLIIDLGAAAHPLQLYCNRSKGFVPPGDAQRIKIGTGISGEVYGYWTKMHALTIDEYTLYGVVTSIPDRKKDSGIGGAQCDGNLGLSVLRRFDLVFDYLHGRLYLKPNSSFSEPFYPKRQ